MGFQSMYNHPMASTNQYHLLARLPAVEAWEMPPALERLAQALVASGQLRISADQYRNYVLHGTADTDQSFSARQLTDPALLPATRQLLARHVPPAAGPDGVEALLAQLRGELKKRRGIAPEKELQVARVVVQSAHSSVMVLILQSGTSVFVSYDHNVAELMAVKDWQTHGTASGLQATSGDGTAVYISCGGDPFFEGAQKTYTTDGFPALARMMVIGGQELGHFSDLKRVGGRIIGRYSTDNDSPALRAAPPVKHARRADMLQVAQLDRRYAALGAARLARVEGALAFYSKWRRLSPPWLFYQLWRLLLLTQVRARVPLKLRTWPRYRLGTALRLFFDDMAFNLAPDADVYRRDEAEEEEAIACIEALARVPQQVHKWGHAAVRLAWPQLYAVYFGQVIPGCIAAVDGLGQPPVRPPFFAPLQRFWRHLRHGKPGYYP